MLRTGELHPPKEGLTPRYDAQVSPKRRRATTKVTWFLLWPDLHRLVIVNFRTRCAAWFCDEPPLTRSFLAV